MSTIPTHLAAAAALLLAALPAAAQHAGPSLTRSVTPAASSAPRDIRVARRTGVIHIDGRLDEAAWSAASVGTGFLQSYPTPHAPATDPTEVRVIYDDDAIYVGVRMFDAHPDSIAAQLARRDASGIYSDWVHVMIDSYHDRRNAYRFSVNPRGVKKDVLEYNESSEDINWDAVWDVATTIDSLGWVAEYRIPLSQLRFGSEAEGEARVWGFQVQRDIARRNERDSWSPWTPQDGGFVSRFGDMSGMVNLPTRLHGELLPYVSDRLTRAPAEAGNPFFRANDMSPSIGADFKVGLPKGLTLTGAINPDFGQVEVDPAVVNLSAFETFFPEKRPFFTEGSGTFSFGQVRTFNNFQFQQFFYSRRIGRSPSRAIDAPFVDAPDATTIAGAAKLTGRVGAWSVGAIDAVATREQAAFREDATAPVQHATVEPLSNYFVGRLRRDFRGGASVLGGMLTVANRSLGDTALASLLHSRALFGGLDFEHGWQRGTWYASGYAAGSLVGGSANRLAATQQSSTHYFQRPDASYLHLDPTRTSLTGFTGEVALQRTGHVFGSLGYKTESPGFEINDLGFQGRSDYHALSSLIGVQSFTANRRFQSYSAIVYTNKAWNYGGTPIYNGIGVSTNATFRNFWTVNVGGSIGASAESDRLTRGGPLARAPGSRFLNASVGSDSRRPLSVQAGASAGQDAYGTGHSLSPFLTLTARPTSFVLVTLGPTLSRQVVSNQFMRSVSDPTASATFGRRYVFGELHQTTFSAETRINWTFTPTLSLQLYAQPFVSSGRYQDVKELHAAASGQFDVYGRAIGAITRSATTGGYTVDPDGSGPAASFDLANPDFNIRSMRGDGVLRWEFRPGSAVYIVWQQQRSGFSPSGDFAFSHDVGAIFREPATNVFLVKFSWWMGT